ncbi:MAG: sigma-54 dependent transcriptional regulator [Candidatus Krumholzibacteriia bacterium]
MTPATRPVQLLLGDDAARCAADLTGLLGDRFTVAAVTAADAARDALLADPPDAVLLDLDLGRGQADGLDLLAAIRLLPDPPPVIMLTGSRKTGDAVRCIKAGAYHYCTKPPSPLELVHLIDQALAQRLAARRLRALQNEAHARHGRLEFADPRMQIVVQEIEQVAPLPSTVLITGPSGVGKEVAARRIHQLSPRADGPFVAVNCAAVPRELAESKFFGHEKGAFTGAESRQPGVFEQAHGGTLFLDEVGDAPADLHTKLLRALEQRTFTRVGGLQELPTDVRVVAATSQDLEADVAAGRFRAELFFRLNVFRIRVPALDDRPADIPHLARHFLRQFATQFGRPVERLSDDALAYLQQRRWPGNVRELRNLVERGVIRCRGDVLHAAHLSYGGDLVGSVPPPYHAAKQQLLRVFQHEYLATQLRNAGGNVTRAAAASGIARQTFSDLLAEVGLDDPAARASLTEGVQDPGAG